MMKTKLPLGSLGPSWTSQGLSSDEVRLRIQEQGFNELARPQRKSLLQFIVELFKEPMFFILAICAGTYFFIGEALDGYALVASVGIVALMTGFQSWKAESALRALRDLSSPRALMIRDGKSQRIPGREVVVDDLMVVSEGDRIVADAEVLDSVHFLVDESLVTGESLPVLKDSKDSLVYAGTLAVGGHARLRVVGTGYRSEIGRIGALTLEKDSHDLTPLQKVFSKLVRTFGWSSLAVSLLILFLYGIVERNWIQGLLSGLAAAMALIPEEFPMVLMVFLALGARRISRARVLVRSLAAAENIGAVSVLCVDKTGTLTENEMKLQSVNRLNAVNPLENEVLNEESREQILKIAAAATPKMSVDPIDIAIRREVTILEVDPARFYPLSPQFPAMAFAYRQEKGYRICLKGAPETVLNGCVFSEAERELMLRAIHAESKQGLRLIAVAESETNQDGLPDVLSAVRFNWKGLLGFSDPVREGVQESIRICHRAGIRVMMITGDHSGTARKIAEEIGLPRSDSVLEGVQLEHLNEVEFKKRVSETNVFARVRPEQKLRIIKALKGPRNIVAMTGDGVNDAPSLSCADVGIAMGQRGTDVAREAAAMVLLDDNFSSIVRAIELGRQIYVNLIKVSGFIVSVHIPITILTLLPALLGSDPILFPIHIVFLEFIIDPACAVVFEAERSPRSLMDQMPRQPEPSVLKAIDLVKSGALGALACLMVGGVYWLVMGRLDADHARTAAFTSLVLTTLALIVIYRSSSFSGFNPLFWKNRFFWGSTALNLSLLICSLCIPSLRSLFHFTPMDLSMVLLGGFGALLTMILGDLLNRVRQSRSIDLR